MPLARLNTQSQCWASTAGQILQDAVVNYESSCQLVLGASRASRNATPGNEACDWHLVGCQDTGTIMRRNKVRRICQVRVAVCRLVSMPLIQIINLYSPMF